ncbi:hypothetical protein BJ875DRAFT_517842 [Amylocarpus encephaloides]|uniref:DUF6594 domain-containing protein n=1 Tax=Amylocarpus encephaloides TaxID=45428 RepID=A0A9P7YCM0_9HELO|nr:hypothetical protein BJ875DRAFT_517842 [Amylocarpus encephaloides]
MDGNAKIANLMSEDPGLAIFRRFGALNKQHLLYLQAELVQLEDELQEQARLDHSFPEDRFRRSFAKSWVALKLSASEKGADQQWEKICVIQEKMVRYYEYLFYSAAISNTSRPNSHNLEFFREWYGRADMGNRPLLDDDQHVWGGTHDEDLIALGQPSGNDVISRWLVDNVTPLLHKMLRSHRPPADIEAAVVCYSSYSDRKLHRCINIISTVISSLFPILSIVLLSRVHSLQVQLCVIAAATSIFSFCLACITEGRRIEIFAATST